ncbi:MAG: hypothetical protein K0R03_1802 [Moraxellaceae bacterium]|jgi:glycosyltransferase involved in cell wall biosynthesis|nr:hypothetical protein [Moraxellaceae bacterium]
MTERKPPLVTVCLPTFNRAAKLREAVAALRESSYRNIEIVISDNGSQDATEQTCRELAAAEPRIRYFRHEENRGAPWNFHFARTNARGKYFMWLGDDDRLDARYIERCVQVLEADPGLVMAAGLGAYHRNDGRLSHYGNVIQAGSPRPAARVATYLWNVSENSIFYGLYDVARTQSCVTPVCLAGDWIWIVDVLVQGRAVVLPDVLVHRDYEDSASSSHARLVRNFGLPQWQARFPMLAASLNLVRHAGIITGRAGYSPAGRVSMALVVAAVMLAKVWRQHAVRGLVAIPGLQAMVRRLRAKSAGGSQAEDRPPR